MTTRQMRAHSHFSGIFLSTPKIGQRGKDPVTEYQTSTVLPTVRNILPSVNKPSAAAERPARRTGSRLLQRIHWCMDSQWGRRQRGGRWDCSCVRILVPNRRQLKKLSYPQSKRHIFSARGCASAGIICGPASVCVYVSVCHTSFLYRNGCTDRSGFWHTPSLGLSCTLCSTGIRVSPK